MGCKMVSAISSADNRTAPISDVNRSSAAYASHPPLFDRSSGEPFSEGSKIGYHLLLAHGKLPTSRVAIL